MNILPASVFWLFILPWQRLFSATQSYAVLGCGPDNRALSNRRGDKWHYAFNQAYFMARLRERAGHTGKIIDRIVARLTRGENLSRGEAAERLLARTCREH